MVRLFYVLLLLGAYFIAGTAYLEAHRPVTGLQAEIYRLHAEIEEVKRVQGWQTFYLTEKEGK